ncbi:fibronectin type III domain-containing protein, partial [Candidatus Woesearchaeota archaeon]|nr:fibronectin type III domain-containing protein [Candidatus Woesearchaeota archaeon]
MKDKWFQYKNFSVLRILLISVIIFVAYGTGTTAQGIWIQKGGTLSADAQGWAYHPSIAVASDGTIYAAWSQHRNPGTWDLVGTYVKKWSNGSWQQLGSRIGHLQGQAQWPEGYSPSISVLGNVPYVAWYEGGGYGWNVGVGASLFVAHWDGTKWVYDNSTETYNGALNNNLTFSAREPDTAVINNKLYVAWIEGGNSVVLKHLDAGIWVKDGVINTGTKLIGVKVFDVAGIPYIVFSGFSQQSDSYGTLNTPGTVKVYSFQSGLFNQVGQSLNINPQSYPNYVAATSVGATPYVAWQERSASGNNQIYVKHWNGISWLQDGGSLNIDSIQGEAGAPALANNGSSVFIAWVEGAQGQKSQLYTMVLESGSWSAPEGTLNVDSVNGSADHPALAVSSGFAQLIWAEKDFSTSTKQVYAKGRGDVGAPNSSMLLKWGADGAVQNIPANTWVKMQPGGIALGSGIGDESYSTFVYVPGLKKAVVFGKYHGATITSGEDQNALLGYDLNSNRWDLVDIGEDAWSEHFSGVGHDSGTVTIDTVRDLFISHGNLNLNAGTAFQTYVYDLKAGRGKRMMSPKEPPMAASSATAFDKEHDITLMNVPNAPPYPTSWLYNYNANNWTSLPVGPPNRNDPAIVYDTKNHVFVMIGPYFNETWTFEPITKQWQKKSPALSPPSSVYYAAFDTLNNVTLSVLPRGATAEVWVYDAGLDSWTQLPNAPVEIGAYTTGSNLAYDTENNAFLLHSGTYLTNTWAFKYVPLIDASAPSIPQNLAASNMTQTSVTLSWSASSDPESGVTNYKVYRNNAVVGQPVSTSFIDTGLAQGTTYTYEVSAVNGAGLESARSLPLNVTTLTDTTPPIISGVTSSSITTSSATINWNTNEPSDSQAEYGLTTAYGLQTTLDTSLVTAHA